MHVLRPNHNMCARIRSRGTLGAVGKVTKGASSPQTRDEAQIFFRRLGLFSLSLLLRRSSRSCPLRFTACLSGCRRCATTVYNVRVYRCSCRLALCPRIEARLPPPQKLVHSVLAHELAIGSGNAPFAIVDGVPTRLLMRHAI